MEADYYQKHILDNKVIKLNTQSCIYLHSKEADMVIGVFFMHSGFPRHNFFDTNERILLDIFRKAVLTKNFPVLSIIDERKILANADHPNYALTYKVKVNEDDRSATIKIEDYPELGEELITMDEVEGLTKQIK